jgi:hypothetical protein
MDFPVVAIPLVWILFYFDYTLTRKGFKYYRKYFMEKVEYESYELNPMLQNAIHDGSRIPSKTFTGAVLIGILVGLLAYIFARTDTTSGMELTLGAILTMYLGLINQHFHNVRVFKFAGDNPETIIGKISFKNEFIYASTKYMKNQFLFVWVFALIFTQSFFVLGAVGGESLMVYIISGWQKSMKFKKIQAEFESKYDV